MNKNNRIVLRRFYLVLVVCAIAVISGNPFPAHADIIFLGSFGGQLDNGFTDLVIDKTGFRVEFVTEPCPTGCFNPSLGQYTTLPGLFQSVGLLLPSSTPRTFIVDNSDPNFGRMASILTSSSVASNSQLFYCFEATNPLITCPYDSFGHWAAIAAHVPEFEFPNAIITSLQLTVSPFAWSGGFVRQPDGSFATLTIAAYGDAFPNRPLPNPPLPNPTVPEPMSLVLFATGLMGMAILRKRWLSYTVHDLRKPKT